MRLLFLVISSVVFLTSCQASNESSFDQSLKIIYPELHTVESVVTDDVIYVAMIVTPLKQFKEQQIAADIKKDLQTQYPNHHVYTSSDMKAIIEVRRLPTTLTKEKLKQLIALDQSIEKDDDQ